MKIYQWLFLVGLVKEIPNVLKLAKTVLPTIGKVPVLGRIVSLLQVPDNEAEYLEVLKRESDKAKRTRKRKRDENNRYVIKVSDALQCVEDNFYDPKTAWTFVKGLLSGLAEGKGKTGFSALGDAVSECIIENALRQDTPRVKVDRKNWPHRPSKGHGYGKRGKF
jgi:hypothetical protein